MEQVRPKKEKKKRKEREVASVEVENMEDLTVSSSRDLDVLGEELDQLPELNFTNSTDKMFVQDCRKTDEARSNSTPKNLDEQIHENQETTPSIDNVGQPNVVENSSSLCMEENNVSNSGLANELEPEDLLLDTARPDYSISAVQGADGTILDSDRQRMEGVIPTAPVISNNTMEDEIVNTGSAEANDQNTNIASASLDMCEPSQVLGQIRSRPVTSTQIKLLYNNYLLENNEEFIRQFLASSQLSFEGFELYELLSNNLRAYNKLTACEKSLASLKDACDDLEKTVWALSSQTLSEKSYCDDNSAVTATYKIHVSEFNQNIFTNLKKTLKELKELLQDSLSLHTYSVQLSKTQIDHFFYKSFGNMELENFQIQQNFSIDAIRGLLHKSLSTLFIFIRRPLLHSSFLKDCKLWIEHCASLLLRIARIEDHLFILNHLLRCPPRVITKWGAKLVQVPPIEIPFGSSSYASASFAHLHLDYALAVLSTILNVIPKREEFLRENQVASKVIVGPSPSDCNQWVVVDSDGEDEPDDVTTFKESDLIALLQQVPFESIFKRILLTFIENGTEIHDIRICSDHSFLRLIAFSLHMVEILGNGFTTYYTDRYRQLTKLLGRLILHTVQYVTDQLESLIETKSTDNLLLPRFRLEYDAFVFNAVEILNNARSIGTLQFMAAIPYHLVSEDMLWEIYHLLTKWDVIEENILRNESISPDFEHELLAISESNAVYMLTTLSTMVMTQNDDKMSFIRIVTLHLFQIGFLSTVTKDTCSKHVRDLLSNMTRKFPQTISTLLHKIKSNINVLDKMALFLLKDLAFDLWKPNESDVSLLSHWLLNFQPSSLENQIGRFIIQSMNWDFSNHDELFLPYELHCLMAILVVSAHLKWEHGQGRITEGVKQLSSWIGRNADLNSWSWEIVRRLHLHAFDRCCMIRRCDFTEVTKDLPSFENSRELEPLRRAVEEKNPVGCTVTLLMTPIGHLLPLICGKGFELLETLVQISKFESAINVLFFVLPLFAASQDSLIENEKFQLVIKSIILADATYIRMAKNLVFTEPGPIAKLFGSMIQAQLDQVSRFEVTEVDLVELWTVVLTRQDNWNKDNHILYWLDIIARFAYSRSEVYTWMHKYFGTIYKEMPVAGNSGLSAIFNWSSHVNTLLPNLSHQFGYINYFILTAETELENSSGFWKSLLVNLTHPKTSLDSAVKKSCNASKFSTSSNYLSIYRWAQQALDTPLTHPLLLIFWQKFFNRYFHRISTHESYRDGVGERFFEGMAFSSFLKKLKKRLHDTLDTYKNQIQKLEGICEDNQLKENAEENTMLLLENLRTCFLITSAMTLWIEDPKFHKDSLYVPALPPQFLSSKLITLIDGDLKDWSEYVDQEAIRKEECAISKLFLTYSNRLIWSGTKRMRFSPWSRGANRYDEFLKRLNSYDKPLNSPPFEEFNKVLPEMNTAMLLDKQLMHLTLKPHFDCLSNFSKHFKLQMSHNAALDCSYCEYLPELYSSVESEALVNVSCTGGKKSSGCSGPARVVFQFTEARLNERIGHLIHQNRTEYHDLIQNKSVQTPSLEVCAAAVFLEDFITNLVLSCRKLCQDEENKDGQAILSVGTELFYFIIGQVNEDTNFYPPTRQLFSSFLDILGCEFVAGRSTESKRLVSTCTQNPSAAGLLAPHINLASCDSKTLLDIYKDIITIQKSESDLVFVLLTKLDLSSWLTKTRNSVSLTERSQLISLIWQALTVNVPEEESRNTMVRDAFRNHLKIMLLYDFPQHFGEILNYLLEDTDKQVCGIDVWYDFFNALSRDRIKFRRGMEPFIKKKELRHFATETDILQCGEIFEVGKLLFDHFTNARLAHGIYGLYPKYKVYMEPISCFLQMVCHLITASALKNSKGMLSYKVVEIVWPAIRDVYAPWILPYDGNTIRQRCAQWIQQINFEEGSILQPFVRNDLVYAMTLMSDFTDCVLFLAETVPGSTALFSNLWNFYVDNFAHSTVKEYVLTVVHNCFISIPWAIFWPSFPDLELMNKVVVQHLPTCHSFLGVVFAQINWTDWISNFVNSNHGNLAVLSKCHSYLLNITVNLANDIVARESPTWVNVMDTVQQLNWQYVSSNSLEPILNWYIMSIDPRVVLSLDTTHHMDKASFTLLKNASGYSNLNNVEPPRSVHINKLDISRKRYLFIRTYVRLIASVSSKYKAMVATHVKCFERAIQNIMTDFAWVVQKENQQLEDFTVHLKEIINLMSNHYLATITRNAFIGWCESNKNSPSCIFMGIIQLSFATRVPAFSTAPLIEIAMELAFKHPDTTWDKVCHLSTAKQDNGEWGTYLDVTSKDGHYLVLNFLLLKKMDNLCSGGLTTLNTLTDLLKNINPREENEAKLPLVYKCFIAIILRLLYEKNKLPGNTLEKGIRKFLSALVHHLGSLADDKQGWGLLGALGLNRSPQISFRGRFFVRCLQLFLQMQMPTNSPIRILVDSSDSSVGDIDSSVAVAQRSSEASSGLDKLEALKQDRQYGELTDSIDSVVELLKDPTLTLSSYNVFLNDLVSRVFAENYLIQN